MNTTVLYGIILVLSQVVINLLSFFTGLQTDHIQYLKYAQYVGTAVIFVALYLGAESKRKETYNGVMTFGQAFGAIFMISLFYAAVGCVTNYLHFHFVNPNFAEYMLDNIRSQMAAQGLPESRIDSAMQFQEKMFQPAIQTIVGFFIVLILGSILGLLHSMALVRRRKLTDLLKIYAAIFGILGLVFGGLGGLMSHSFIKGAATGMLVNVVVALLGWGLLLKLTGYAPDAPAENADA